MTETWIRGAETLRHDPGMAALAGKLNAISDRYPFRITWCVKDLHSGESAGRDDARPTPSASTRKILYLMAAMHAVHEGRMDLAQPVVMTEYLTTGVVSGVLYFMTPGLTFPMRDAIVQMIITSDNVCTTLVGEHLGVDAINAYAQRIGMVGTRINHIVPPREMPVDSNFDFVARTTAADQVRLLEAILRGAEDEAAAAAIGTSTALCRMALDILSWQRHRQLIPGLLPIDARVCNKTGGGRNGLMDAGIVYRAGAPLFAIGAYTDAVPWTMPDGLPGHAMATRAIAEISRQCWDDL